MSYNPTTGKITPPIDNPSDIQRAIGNSSGDVGTLCKAPTVNCWAKFKPVQNNLINTTPQYDYTNGRWKTEQELGYRPWWQGSTNTQIGGIEPKTATQLGPSTQPGTLLYYYLSGDTMNGWVYNKPNGNANQPFRQIDFTHYNHLAPPPLENFYIQSQIFRDGHFSASALMSFDMTGADYLTLKDFAAPSFPNGLYFGVVFVQNSQAVLVVTADTRDVAQVYADFSDSGNQLPLGNYTVYPILCRDQIPITQQYQTANLFLSCPMLSPVQTTIVSRDSTIDVILTPIYMTGENNARIRITNDSVYQITNVMWYLTNSSTTPSGAGTSIGTIDVGETKTVTNVRYTNGQYFHVSFICQGSTYWRKLQLISTVPDPVQA